MLNIGDFSKIAKVSLKTLRHYDQIGLLKPQEVDYITGYRKYSILQLGRLNKILFYKDLGFSLKQISNLIEDDITTGQMTAMLMHNKNKIELDIKNAQEALKHIENRIKMIEETNEIPEYEFQIIDGLQYNIVFRRMLIPTIPEITFYSNKLYNSLYEELSRLNIDPTGPEMNLYHNKAYTTTDIDLEFSVAIKGTPDELKKITKSDLDFRKIRDVNQTLSLKFSGHYHNLDYPIIEGLKWIETNNYILDGDLREVHLSGQAHINGELQQEALVELQFPIKKMK